MTRHPRLVASFALTIIAGPAAAQDFQMNNDFIRGYTNTMVNTTVRESLLGIDSSRRGPPTPTPRGAQARPNFRPSPAARSVDTRYRPSPQVAARVRQQFLSYVAQKSGRPAAEQIGREFARKDYLRLWAANAASDGLHANDVADALASYWVQNWLIANGMTDAPSAQIRAVRAQVNGLLGRNPGFARMGEAQKQEMAEIIIYNQIVQGEVYSGAVHRGDRNLQRQLANAAAVRFRNEMGLNLRALALTPRGFVSRG